MICMEVLGTEHRQAVLFFTFFSLHSFRLYLFTRASGGLILIARQASKCYIWFLCSWKCLVENKLEYFAWRIIMNAFVSLSLLTRRVCVLCVLWFLLLVWSCHGRMFGFVARRTGSTTENVCHLFAEMDPEQPAVAIVNFINKVMLGPQLHRWNICIGSGTGPDRSQRWPPCALDKLHFTEPLFPNSNMCTTCQF